MCSLCGEKIDAGERHVYLPIVPWVGRKANSHYRTGRNEYVLYRAHIRCDDLWERIGWIRDWRLPESSRDWFDLLGDAFQQVDDEETLYMITEVSRDEYQV